MVKSVNEKTSESFNSPLKIQELDQIPTSILKWLTTLGPLLHELAKLCEIIMWKRTARESILTVLIWMLFCLFTWQLLAALPCWVLYRLIQDWFQLKTSKTRREQLEKKRKLEQQHMEQDDQEEDDRAKQLRLQQLQEQEDELLISRKIRPDGQVLLDDTLKDMAIINQCIQQLTDQWKPILNQIDGTNRSMSISILSVLMYMWPLWCLFCYLFGAHTVFAVLGTFFLVSLSPQVQFVWFAFRRNRLVQYVFVSLWAYGVAFITSTLTIKPFSFKQWLSSFWRRAKSEKEKAVDIFESAPKQVDGQGSRSEMVFQFEIYENQRWWLGVNWTTNMMPSEREAWTDGQLRAVKSKESFKLPESSITTTQTKQNNKLMQVTVHKVWSWADGDWWVDMTGELSGKIDHHGWEYGNNAWKQLSGTPGMQTFTRRRRWCRRARLVEKISEKEQDNKKID